MINSDETEYQPAQQKNKIDY